MTDDSPRQEIADEIATAQEALARARDVDTEHEVLSRGERENLSVPSGRLRSVQNTLPEPTGEDN